ncbi:ATP-binding protein [Clostridium sp. B9]|uniref:sensor histidine kinase n=1 Tax=Clostridium sp. B9 TaxID=3423224 RepID=UPI003D2ECDA6
MARHKRKISIRTRMLISILGLIFTIFLGIVISFNLTVEKYIEKSSHTKIEKVRDMVKDIDDNMTNPGLQPKDKGEHNELDFFIRLMRKIEEDEKRIGISSGANFMMVNEDYKVVFPNQNQFWMEKGSQYDLIAEKLKDEKIDLDSHDSYRLALGKSNYYVSFVKVGEVNGDSDYYIITYIDISNTLILAEEINKVLIIIMALASILAIILSIILSKRIAKPIEEISSSVEQLGEGNFIRCDYDFSDKELDKLCNIINKTSEQLESYDKEQKTFFQNVSHELRTPLMSIKGYAEGIKYDVIDKELATNIILEEGDRLEELIEEILYLSKIDNITRDYILEERDLREILSNCVIKQKMVANKNNIEFIYDFDHNEVLYMCNEKSLYRAFSNIIENSLRYAKSKIKITCRNQGENILISIENDGEHITIEDLPNIFDRFYKGKKGKHGIGLSIVKSIIEKQGGCISAENTEEGVKFLIEFRPSI